MPRPVVVEFKEPCPFPVKARPALPAAEKGARSAPSVDFATIKGSVLDFGRQALQRNERLRKQEVELVALGCAPRRNQKVPRKIAMAISRAKKTRAKAIVVKQAESGLVVARSSKPVERAKKRPHTMRGPDGPGHGVFRNGMLVLNAKDPFGERRSR